MQPLTISTDPEWPPLPHLCYFTFSVSLGKYFKLLPAPLFLYISPLFSPLSFSLPTPTIFPHFFLYLLLQPDCHSLICPNSTRFSCASHFGSLCVFSGNIVCVCVCLHLSVCMCFFLLPSLSQFICFSQPCTRTHQHTHTHIPLFLPFNQGKWYWHWVSIQ